MTSEKKEIESREEVSLLVRGFYAKIRVHAELGPIFNGIVEDWEQHLERLTDFWEMVLLQTGPGAGKFNPVPVHKEVDNRVNNEIEQRHFGNWLELWFETIDSKFEGVVADYAKNHARKMAHILFFKILEGRGHQ
ncbi:group III truncated hemoglobin [Belliella aquatica]|uniref:Preprotein translocase subunit TatC n=1 Tax=Belliella aquatica TaxID=1323734 RepID=A0ABQ1MXI4_9BACT|nr:group III truncated hemoglobin [Belliella aquatica]MCH7406553.1 group III truncated hemoglobin [Belliella aquatica]GGC46871.1 preprotein translocase subunit TatC [Belliella aquatica]